MFSKAEFKIFSFRPFGGIGFAGSPAFAWSGFSRNGFRRIDEGHRVRIAICGWPSYMVEQEEG
jgi:hypothetical protein